MTCDYSPKFGNSMVSTLCKVGKNAIYAWVHYITTNNNPVATETPYRCVFVVCVKLRKWGSMTLDCALFFLTACTAIYFRLGLMKRAMSKKLFSRASKYHHEETLRF